MAKEIDAAETALPFAEHDDEGLRQTLGVDFRNEARLQGTPPASDIPERGVVDNGASTPPGKREAELIGISFPAGGDREEIAACIPCGSLRYAAVVASCKQRGNTQSMDPPLRGHHQRERMLREWSRR